MTGSGGPAMFARFAYPPNALELCGPADHAALLEASAAARPEAAAELRHLAVGFAGAWPYLQLIAAANGIEDPLQDRVVEAYWIGNELLDAVPSGWLADELDRRFRRAAGRQRGHITEAALAGGRPHHNFHVFAVYPWVGLLRGDTTGEPLRVLDRCRIRAGTVVDVGGDRATIASTTLTWDGRQLAERPCQEALAWQREGYRLGTRPAPGDVVALHWEWVCQPLTAAQAVTVARWTRHHLVIANRQLAIGDRQLA